ncbi:MAG: ribose-5-phosphate isomerase RpiA [Thermoplasmata archaeon]|nr:MAG: ribose-5-phosphate isomerase RpiA [Thermoplasmata archaeon]
MTISKEEQDKFKMQAAHKAVEYVEDGMVVGLGTGSTVRFAIQRLADLMETEKMDIVGIPTSIETERLAKELKIPLTDLKTHPDIDLTIDGADEVDPSFTLIKGMGGALLREKIVAVNTKQQVIVIDYTKKVDILGTKSPLPVEVLPFGWASCERALKDLGCSVTLRTKNDKTVISDNNNYILDCKFKSIDNPEALESKINNIPGVIENGLFINLTSTVIVASPEGIEVLLR